MYADSQILGPDGEPYNLVKTAQDKGAWREIAFVWTLSHEALRAQWPLAHEIRTFFPTFVPLGVEQVWRSPNGSSHKFFRCVIAQSKPGYEFSSTAGTERNRVHVTPPLGFPFPLPGPIFADRTLVWWPHGEEGLTPGKYVDFAMYLTAMKQAIHRRNHQDPSKAEAEDIALIVEENRRQEAADRLLLSTRRADRRKERLRTQLAKSFVPHKEFSKGPEHPARGRTRSPKRSKPC